MDLTQILHLFAKVYNAEVGDKVSISLKEKAGIKTVLNFADSAEALESYKNKEDFNSQYYYDLYKAGQVIPLNMSVDIGANDFANKLAQGVRFLITKEGPYLFIVMKVRIGPVSCLLCLRL